MKENKERNKSAGDVVEEEDGDAFPQPPLPLLVQDALAVPQYLQVDTACSRALPQAWLVHHHQDSAGAGPEAGRLLLSLLLLEEGPLVPLLDLCVMVTVAAVTGTREPLAKASLLLLLVLGVDVVMGGQPRDVGNGGGGEQGPVLSGE
jgi:hypothetical protein